MAGLHREANAPAKCIEVRLFCVECANNFYLGEFLIERIEKVDARTYLRLRRLVTQDERVRRSYEVIAKPKRSRSEAKHADVIRALLPTWAVRHEPECVIFDGQLVVDGRMREWGGDQYVCDYVAARGTRRVCFESKASPEGFDETAKLKCQALRDSSLTRVVALVGHGDALTWHDFGCPVARREASGALLVDLRLRLTEDAHRKDVL